MWVFLNEMYFQIFLALVVGQKTAQWNEPIFKIAALTKQFMHGNNHNRLSLKMFKNGKKQTSGSLKGPPSEAQSKAPIIPLQKAQNERSHNVKSFPFFIW